MKSESSTEMLSSPSPHSTTCEYDLCIILPPIIIISTQLQLHASVWSDCLCCIVLNSLCVTIVCRDLSMNSLTLIPTTGLSALSQLKLSGNPQMKNVLTAKNLPKLRWESTFVLCCRVLLSEVLRKECRKVLHGWSCGCWHRLCNCNVPSLISAKEFDVIMHYSPWFLSALNCHALI